MQNSSLFRRGIVVPLDEDAEESLRCGNVTKEIKVRYLRIPDILFDVLVIHGFFKEINRRCKSLLDDYEDEIVESSSAGEILTAIGSMAANGISPQSDLNKFLNNARNLVKEARDLSRPILFVL
jgi:hypothetical protein